MATIRPARPWRDLFQLAVEVKERPGVRVDFVNTGGGVGIPYRPEETEVDLQFVSDGMRECYDRVIRPSGLHPLSLFMELGRAITGPHGYLMARVLHIKRIYKTHVGLDACMARLMRPAIYGAYHHITVVGKDGLPADHVYDVTGSLCESNDKLRSAELLLRDDGRVVEIRRAETVDDLFATLDFDGVERFT